MRNRRWTDVEDRYRILRHAARVAVMEEFVGSASPEIRLAEIGHEALAAAGGWKNRRVVWDWEQLVRKLKRRPRRIELAIWVDPVLCGLAVGRISDRRVSARIDRLERAPGTFQLAGLIGEIATVYLDTIGTLAGCREAVISKPAESLLDFYKELGYTKEIIKHGKVIGLKKILLKPPVPDENEGIRHEETSTR